MLKRGKAAGFDDITVNMLQNMGQNGLEILTELFMGGREDSKGLGSANSYTIIQKRR